MTIVRTLVLAVALGWGVCGGVGAEVIKGEFDTREYRYLVLPNNLRVVLVSDAEAGRAAAAMNVGVGNGSDPKGREGMAHFLEHMLFLGTRKYPDAGEYQRFIRAHGGHRNAWTALERTVYHFDIDAEFLEEALDRFASFFTGPLFDASLVERERSIVDSEYMVRRGSEGRRMWTVARAAYNPRHPMSRFAAGNEQTLAQRAGEDVRGELIAFFRKYYAARVMTLAVLGREPLDVLQRWVESRFGAIPDHEVPPMMGEQPLFVPGSLPALLYARPKEERRRLELIFPVPEILSRYRTRPLLLLSELLGHEGKGSLLSVLKGKDWATGVYAGAGLNLKAHATFGVNIMLTEQGLRHWREVAAHLFHHIDLVRAQGLQAWRYEEQQRLARIGFVYRERARPPAHVIALSGALHRYPEAHLVDGPWLLQSFDPDEIRRYLDHLRPDNAMVLIEGREVPVDAKTPYYEVEYSLQPLSPGWVAELAAGDRKAQRLPGPNRFIPKRLSLKEEAGAELPRRLTDGGVQLWHRNDVSYRTPHAAFYFTVRSAGAYRSAADYVLTGLYLKAASESLNEYTYAAHSAGLGYGMYQGARGYTVRLSGYDEKQRLLLRRILKALRKPPLSAEHFDLYREELIRHLQNYRYDNLYSQLYDQLPELLMEPHWSAAERVAAARRLTYAQYREFARNLHKRINITALAHGNITAATARRYGRMLKRQLLRSARPASVPNVEVRRLPTTRRHYLRLKRRPDAGRDAATLIYIQGNNDSPAERARFAMLSELLGPLFYDEFRVRRDLGYIVFVSNAPLQETPGLAFTVQSSSYSTPLIERYIEEFLAGAEATLALMPQAEFASFQSGLIDKLHERHRTLRGRSESYWREITAGYEDFDSEARIEAALRALTRSRMAALLGELVAGSRANRLVIEAGEAEPGRRPEYPPGPPLLIKSGAGAGAEAEAGALCQPSAQSLCLRATAGADDAVRR